MPRVVQSGPTVSLSIPALIAKHAESFVGLEKADLTPLVERIGDDAHPYGHARTATGIDACRQPGFVDATQNARLVARAEPYYRVMYYGSRASWNLRDSHMFETLQKILDYPGPHAKAVITGG